MLELLFPPQCLLCQQSLPQTEPPQLCPSCLQQISCYEGPLPIPGGVLYTVGEYRGNLAKLIGRLKYSKELSVAKTLATLMTQQGLTTQQCVPYDCIVPVPLHRRDLARRGFNQAQLLANEVARTLELRREHRGLAKQKKTAHQTTLSRKERQRNLTGAFVTRRSFWGESCLLVDDVYTTGTTTADCSQMLRRAGALRVDVLTAARTA